MLIMPFAHDQFDNAARVQRLGVGRRISRRRYSAATAASELATLLQDARARQNAPVLAGQIRTERALERTCDALERLLTGDSMESKP
jgi:UDP:flavonoid glycosyltransferase YjiC (YdhE family)